MLSDLMTASAQTLTLPLRSVAKQGRQLPQGCCVTLKAEELVSTNAMVCVSCGGPLQGTWADRGQVGMQHSRRYKPVCGQARLMATCGHPQAAACRMEGLPAAPGPSTDPQRATSPANTPVGHARLQRHRAGQRGPVQQERPLFAGAQAAGGRRLGAGPQDGGAPVLKAGGCDKSDP